MHSISQPTWLAGHNFGHEQKALHNKVGVMAAYQVIESSDTKSVATKPYTESPIQCCTV